MPQIQVYATERTEKVLRILERTGIIENRSKLFTEMIYRIAEENQIRAGVKIRLDEMREQVRELEKLLTDIDVDMDESQAVRSDIVRGYCERREVYDKAHWQEQSKIDYDPISDLGVKRSVSGYLTAPKVVKDLKIAFPGVKSDEVYAQLETIYQEGKAKR